MCFTRWLRKIHHQLNEIIHLLHLLVELELGPPPTRLLIFPIGDTMLPFDPGVTGIKLQAVFLPPGSSTPTSFTVAWTSSDPNVTVTADPADITGLTADVAISADAVVASADSITATATGTNADGSSLNVTGSFDFTISQAPSPSPTGLGITQIA
ncbi:MAG TPA: hypothetical protein VK638_00655 [Edaphobacter sp.]|nr:hypothetical protein [Edaphobacter sp.]